MIKNLHANIKHVLLSLLWRPKIPMHMRLGDEDRICVQAADYLRLLCLEESKKLVWFHPANEGKRHRLIALLLKAMGLIPGTPDIVILWGNGCGLIELKSKKGRQNDNQKYFQAWAEYCGVPYAVCRSVDEVRSNLRKWGALS